MATVKKQWRRKLAHHKFLLGLSFEKAGLALVHQQYLGSEQALHICQTIIHAILGNSALEHAFYHAGEQAFHSKTFMDDKLPVQNAQKRLGNHWKRIRYHHLVRLGGDILRSGLADYPKATLLGALFWYNHQETSEGIACHSALANIAIGAASDA